MDISIDQTIKTHWHEWESGEIKECKGCIFQQVIFDKPEQGIRIRLVFEQDLMNQHIVNMNYDWLPGKFNIILDAIGKKVQSVVAEGAKDHAAYIVTFEDGYWFKI